jgi:hypothetical protein
MVDMNILIVTPEYPPLGSPQSIQSYRMAYGFAKCGCKVDVLAAEAGGGAEKNHHLQYRAPDISGVKVFRFKHKTSDPASVSSRLYRLCFPYDPYRYGKELRIALESFCVESAYDIVIAISEPFVTHVCVNKAIRNSRLVYWLSDPVPLGDEFKDIIKFKFRRMVFEQQIRRNLKANCIVCGVTTEIVEPFIQILKFPSSKVFTANHTYIDSDWGPVSEIPKRNKQLVILHSGAIYWKRKPFKLINGATSFATKNRVFLKILLQGAIEKQILQSLSPRTTYCDVEIQGPASYQESVVAMRSSDILCIIDVELDKNCHLPSKVADYVAANKPILYIGKKTSPTTRALQGYAGFYCAENEFEVEQGLQKIVQAISCSYDNLSVKKQFESECVYKKLLKQWLSAF